MNYRMYKLRKRFLKFIFSISVIKKWYIGHELLKNPPNITVENTVLDGVNITNTTVSLNNNSGIHNAKVINTLKYAQYF